MVDRHHRHSVNQIEEPRPRPRWGSLANERTLLDLLDGDQQNLQPTSLKLAPINNSNIYARRHSAHTCPITEERHASTGVSTRSLSQILHVELYKYAFSKQDALSSDV
jgi:hypothetical protein